MAELSARTDQARSFLETGSEAARLVRRAGFRALLAGEPVGVEELATRSGLNAGGVRQALAELETKGLARLDAEGRLVGAAGLSVVPSRHRLEFAGTSFYTWCALDAVGIPAALGEDARVATACPHCGRDLDVEIHDGRPMDEGGRAIWLPLKSCSSVADEFCPDINLFCDEAHLRDWRSRMSDPPGNVLTLAQAADLGRAWWGEMW